MRHSTHYSYSCSVYLRLAGFVWAVRFSARRFYAFKTAFSCLSDLEPVALVPCAEAKRFTDRRCISLKDLPLLLRNSVVLRAS